MLMKRYCLVLLFFVGSGALYAQTDDPVLMRVQDREVLRSEFVGYYNRYRSLRKPAHEVAQLYADNLLKVYAAEQAGLGEAPDIQAALDAYRHGLIEEHLTDKGAMEKAARSLYDKLLAEGRLSQVKVQQICLYLSQNVTATALRRAEQRMDSLYLVLKADTTAARFAACVERLSDDKTLSLFRSRQMLPEFEAVVDRLQPGTFSAPFLTPQGIHIVRLLERMPAPGFETVKPLLLRRLARNYRTDKGAQASVETLKEKYGFTSDQAAVSELLNQGATSRTLFTLDGKPYDGSMFARFASTYPAAVTRQWEAFVTKSVLDYADSKLEQEQTDFHRQVRNCRDSLLITALTQREMGEERPLDEAALQAYFEQHRSEYRWHEPRYRGIVLHATTKRAAKQARKLLKQLPESEWQDALRLVINADGKQLVRAEQGLFTPGDNPFVDRKIFKKGDKPTPDVSYPFTYYLGKKLKAPEGYEEVREALVEDYRHSLERQWLERLRASGKVEIDQVVLKTVNNP